MPKMYPGKANSPSTTLTDGINDISTVIVVADASVLPAAPNLATLGSDQDAETILYAAITENTLSGVMRGFQGTAKAWPIGAPVARLFTEYDYKALSENIRDLEIMQLLGG